jgi:hypothetical protein
VLADLASSIHSWLTAELAPGTVVGFDPPHVLAQHKPPRAGVVNVFLYAITEDRVGMPAARMRVHDADGRVTGTLAPPRFYNLSYLVTAWAAGIEQEFQLLGAVLEAHAERDTVSVPHLIGSLASLDGGLAVRLGWAPVARGNDLWGALGIPMRSALDLTVTAPAQPSRLGAADPLVRTRDLDLHDTVRRTPATSRTRLRGTPVTEH